MAAKDFHSLEHKILLSLTDKAVEYISLDRLNVAQKLVSKGVLPESFITSSKKSEHIFENVVKAVDLNPSNFEEFLSVINECPSVKGLAKLIQDEKRKQGKVPKFSFC